MRGISTFILIVACTLAPRAGVAQVGKVTFPNSGAREAQDAFLHGVAQLHNFQYGEAAEAFREAQRIDPDFVMAYWGEAMTYNHPIWLEQDSTAARRALARLGASREARLAKARTDRERAYLEAVETLYGSGGKESRDLAYSTAMRRVHERYPDDPEAAAFYALSILGTAHGGRDFSIYVRAASIAEAVFNAHPTHPGAAHYLIHSYDDPVHAPLGLRAARAYSTIAPDAAHAQHMTSHIFVAMGMWDDVVAANENARRVARTAVERRGGQPAGCGHYNYWLQYGYLQVGRLDDARALLQECYDTASGAAEMRRSGDLLDADATSRGSYASMLARYVLDTEAWDHESLRWPLPLDDLFPARLTWAYINGYAAAKRGELVKAQVSREAIAGARRELDRYLSGTPSGGDANLGVSFQTRARILEMQLEALIQAAGGRYEEALSVLSDASAMEEGLPLFFGPPFVEKPSRELLGEVMLEAGRAQEAATAFRAALERTPGRVSVVRGLELSGTVASDGIGSSEEAAVLATVQAFFDALAAGDGAAGSATLLDGAVLVGTTSTADGIEINRMDRAGFVELIEGRAGMLERMWDATVWVRGAIATVWTPYDFHRGGEFSHCGTDAFNLVKTDRGWRIASVVWTVERTGCAPSPLGPPRDQD